MIVLDNLDEKIYPLSSPREYVLETFGGLNSTDIDKLIYENFLSWLGKTPKLDKVKYPSTFAYVEDEKDKDILKMQEEMKNEEIYVPKGQHFTTCRWMSLKSGRKKQPAKLRRAMLGTE